MERVVSKDGWGVVLKEKEEEEEEMQRMAGAGPEKEWRVEGRATGQNREPLGGKERKHFGPPICSGSASCSRSGT